MYDRCTKELRIECININQVISILFCICTIFLHFYSSIPFSIYILHLIIYFYSLNSASCCPFTLLLFTFTLTLYFLNSASLNHLYSLYFNSHMSSIHSKPIVLVLPLNENKVESIGDIMSLISIKLPIDIYAYEEGDHSIENKINAKLMYVNEEKNIHIIYIDNVDVTDDKDKTIGKDKNKKTENIRDVKDDKDDIDKTSTGDANKNNIITSINSDNDYKIRKSKNDGWLAWKFKHNNLPICVQSREQMVKNNISFSDLELIASGFVNTLSEDELVDVLRCE